MTRRRHRLAQRRKTVGLSQERLAEIVGVDRSTIVRWERADTDPQPWHRPRLAKALDVSVEELADLLAEPLIQPRRSQDGLRSDSPLIDSRREVQLRTGYSEAPATGDVGALQALRNADRQFGGGHLYASVRHYLEEAIAPRLFGLAPHNEEHEVFVAAASLVEMAGWMAHDAGRHATAGQHLIRAAALARSAGDSPMLAQVLGSRGHLALHQGDPRAAMSYASQGRLHLARCAHQPGLAARLEAVHARAFAAVGDKRHGLERLGRAERLMSRGGPEAASPFVSCFDEASLAIDAARCLELVGDLTAARREAERAITLRSPDRVRSRALARLLLVSILVAQGRPNEACGVAVEVLRTTRSLGSQLVASQLARVGGLLAPYRRSGSVASFLECLSRELRERNRLMPQPSPAASPSSLGTV